MLAHLSKSCPLQSVLAYLLKDDNVKTIFASLEGSYGLCLMANITHLTSEDLSALQSDTVAFTVRSFCVVSDLKGVIVPGIYREADGGLSVLCHY